jgi:uncharacterized protein (TIGR02466 family)
MLGKRAWRNAICRWPLEIVSMAGEIALVQSLAWPTVFYTVTWPDHVNEAPAIIAYLRDRQAAFASNVVSGVARVAKSRQGLVESDFDLLESPHPGLARLKAFIDQVVRAVVVQVNGSRVTPDSIRPVITESWFHITNDGGFHDAHVHNQCSWCGIYYLQAGDSTPSDESGPGNGVNRFYSPLPNGGAISDYGNTYLRSNRIDVVPKDGTMVLFPSYLMHSALAYRGPRDRIVISFNSQTSLDPDYFEASESRVKQ